MTRSFQTIVQRIFMLMCIMILIACGEEERAEAPQAPPRDSASETIEGTIVAVGDSLTAGYGLSEGQAYPALLENRLRQNGYPFKVVNAGISGETSSEARSRIEWIMSLNPDIVVLGTGANDGLRGIDPALTRENIDAIVAYFNNQGVVVVLAGMKMVKNMGREFTEAFEGLYPAIAADKNAILIPFLLEGVAAEPSLNQPDGIHPTAEGYEKVTDVVYPYVVEAIERFRGKAG